MFYLILPLHGVLVPRNTRQKTRINASQTSDISATDKGVKCRTNRKNIGLFGTAGGLIYVGFKTYFTVKLLDTRLSDLDKKLDRLDTKIDIKIDNLDMKLDAKFDNMHYLNYILISGVVYALTRKNNK